MSKILITGTTGLAEQLRLQLISEHDITNISQSNGYDINNCSTWSNQFIDYDIIINCAYSGFGQVNVLTQFSNMWGADINKSIINIGSTVVSYPFTDATIDTTFVPYRMHKLALLHCFEKHVRNNACHTQLINPGIFNSAMTANNNNKKMDITYVAKMISTYMFYRNMKRIDFWE